MNQERLNEIEKSLIQIVERDVVPALGCTEPISLALAAATAAKYLGKTPERIEAKVSPNLMKNGLGVAVPGTGMVGLPIAAAIGALAGDPEGELEVLKHITPEQVSQAKAMLDEKYYPDGYNIGMNCGQAAGQSVMHVHVHLIPRYNGDIKNPRGGIRGVIPKKQSY